MSKPKFVDAIRRLDIPAKCKAEMSILFAKARHIAVAILRFIKAHRRFATEGVKVAPRLKKKDIHRNPYRHGNTCPY